MMSPGLPQDGAWSMEVEHSVKHSSSSSNNSPSNSPNNNGSPNSPNNSPHSSTDNSSSSPSRKRRRLVSTRSLRMRDDGQRENATSSSASMLNQAQSWSDNVLHPPPLVRHRRSPRHHLSSNNIGGNGNNNVGNGHNNNNTNGPHIQSSPPPLRRARYRERNSWPEGITPLFQTSPPSTHQPSLVVDINVPVSLPLTADHIWSYPPRPHISICQSGHPPPHLQPCQVHGIYHPQYTTSCQLGVTHFAPAPGAIAVPQYHSQHIPTVNIFNT